MDRVIYTLQNALRSPVILTGPHNGWYVPDRYVQDGMPLGLEPSWFEPENPAHRHEACDWGIQSLFDAIAAKNSSVTLLSANLSRLVVDLNRTKDLMIYSKSSELECVIPGNCNISNEEIETRYKEYYLPYHKALDDILQATKQKFGHVIWLDMHSFSPIWLGEPRVVGIGTLKCGKTAFSEKAENHLHQAFGEAFVADEPYPMFLPENQIISGSLCAAKRNNIEYFGLEIRNDFLQKPQQIENMADKMLDFIAHLHP